jgi:hypothetical protein
VKRGQIARTRIDPTIVANGGFRSSGKNEKPWRRNAPTAFLKLLIAMAGTIRCNFLFQV